MNIIMTNDQFYSITNKNAAQSNITISSVIASAYGKNEKNWGDRPAFQGDFINLGYWKDIPCENKIITVEDRILSSKKLYEYTIELSGLHENFDFECHSLLEIGCGRGVGLVSVFLNYDFKYLKNIIGLDMTLDQLKRAVNIHWRVFQKPYPFHLIHASADNTTCSNQSIDHIISVEVAQHFKSFKPFAAEMKRILKPGGKLVFVAHLATSKKNHQKLRDKQLLIDNQEIDILEPVDEAIRAFRELNFHVNCFSIGKYVFPGFNKWIEQVEKGTEANSSKIFESYIDGYIDYYAFIISSQQ